MISGQDQGELHRSLEAKVQTTFSPSEVYKTSSKKVEIEVTQFNSFFIKTHF